MFEGNRSEAPFGFVPYEAQIGRLSQCMTEGIDSANGPRTIVFNILGTIVLRIALLIERSFLTISGQTAPSDGMIG